MSAEARKALAEKRGEVMDLLRRSAYQVVEYDWYLLRENLKEEAINHRLAVYLEQAIKTDRLIDSFRFSVDSEYDRWGAEPKTLPGGIPDDQVPPNEKGKPIRPDVIIHQRGARADRINFLAVEVKKRPAATPGSNVRRYALWKCRGFPVSNMHYIFSAYVSFRTGPTWDRFDPVSELILFWDGGEWPYSDPPTEEENG